MKRRKEGRWKAKMQPFFAFENLNFIKLSPGISSIFDSSEVYCCSHDHRIGD